jgi:hypothetical protein
MYGGELSDRQVSYALSALRKQQAVIKLPKVEPHIVRIPDVPDIDLSKEQLESYIAEIYKNPVYVIPNEVIHDQTQRLYENEREVRIKSKPANTRPPGPGEVVDGQTVEHIDLPTKSDSQNVFDIFRASFGV